MDGKKRQQDRRTYGQTEGLMDIWKDRRIKRQKDRNEEKQVDGKTE